MIEDIKLEVNKLLKDDKTGHGVEHINRVLELSLKFAKEENADIYITSLIALLHDVDDYKLFDSNNDFLNAKNIMNKCNVAKDMQAEVLTQLEFIGYSKRLRGLCPNSLEGKIVSDADMCDAMGATGIIRAYTYSLRKENIFFDKDIFPQDNIDYNTYINKSSPTVCHLFEKILKLKNLMLTESGKKEALKRQEIVVSFLYHFFDEQNAKDWIDYLNNYLQDNE